MQRSISISASIPLISNRPASRPRVAPGVRRKVDARSWKKGICYSVISALAFHPFSIMAQPTIDPPSINVGGGSAVCSGGSETIPLSITLPPGAVSEKVDVFFLFDDTGSFAEIVPTVTSIFSGLVGDLETALPGVEFGFGVARFEDYGGSETGFSDEDATGRPFTLNQPIITATGAGGAAERDTLINDALARTAPGLGGDDPESAVEGLFQTATGIGFDGDGDGSTLDSGAAGLAATQTSPGTSGDVPAFSSNVAPTSGTLGGAGWRSNTLRLTILATDICPVAAFPAGASIPATITGAGAASVPVSAFACSSTTPGDSRFGFVSNSKTTAGNTVSGAVVPSEAGTVQGTLDALNTLGIRVLGMGPEAGPTDSTGPATDASVFLSALARLTGALDSTGDPLVFSTSVSLPTLRDTIVDALTTTATAPVDITLARSALPAGLMLGSSPGVVDDVPPGGTAPFEVTLTGDGTPISGSFDINFVDANSGAVVGTVPATAGCPPPPPPPLPPAIPPTGVQPASTCSASGCGVPLTCPDTTTACTSQINLTVRASAVRLGSGPGASATARRRITFAAAVANVPPGSTVTVRVPLNRNARKIRTRLLNRNVTRLAGRLEVRNISGAIVSNTPITIRLRAIRPR